jgi:hypothetical protein
MSIIDSTGWYLIGIGYGKSINNTVNNMIPTYKDISYNYEIKKAFKLDTNSTSNFNENDWEDITEKKNNTDLIETDGDYMGVWVFVLIETREDGDSNNLINVVPEIFKNKIIDGSFNTLTNVKMEGTALLNGNLLSRSNLNILDDSEKNNQKTIMTPLEKLNQLKPKNYSNNNNNEFGFLVNDLLKTDISNCILNINDKTVIDYNNIFSLNVAATQELYKFIKNGNYKTNLDKRPNNNNNNKIINMIFTNRSNKYKNKQRNKILFK